MRNHKTELTKEMAERMLNGEDISRDYLTNPNTKNEINMDYVFGRCCKTTLYVLENQVKVIISERDREPKKIFKKVVSIGFPIYRCEKDIAPFNIFPLKREPITKS